MNKSIFVFLSIILCFSKLCAQDIHFTGFEFSPLHVNPANTGGFNGSYRIGGIYRDQARSIANAYSTPHFYMDATFPWAFRKKDWTGFGISFLKDQSGEIALGHSSFVAVGAYHLSLGRNGNSNISLGVQYGPSSFSTDPTKARFYESLVPMPTSEDQKSVQQKGSYKDLTVGLTYGTKLTNSAHILKMGFAIAHLNKPKFQVFSGQGVSSLNKLPMLFTANASLQYNISNKLDVTPMLWFRNLSKASNTSIQAKLGYLYNAEKEIKLNIGLGYRLADAAQVMLGIDYGNIKAQLAYDLSLSSISTAQSPTGFGAIELGVSYIGTVVKKPNPKPKVFCPRF